MEEHTNKEGIAKKMIKELFVLLLYMALAVLLTFLIITFVGQRTKVSGSSMEPFLHNNDNLIVEKLSYRFTKPKRFDVIVFPGELERYYIKRIIGLPGETVRIDDDGVIYIDGKELMESYGKEVIQNPGIAAEEVVLGEDEYFVLGDNRNNSEDSRSSQVGAVQREEIIGRAWMRIYPFDEIGFIRQK